MASSKSLVIVSDIHVGSKYAICTESPERDSDNPYKPNKLQKKLLEGWDYCVDRISQKPRALVVNGEPIDGANRFNMGDSVWSVEINDQIEDATKLLNTIKSDNLIFVRGSGYHVTRDATSFEKTIADKMKAKKYMTILGNLTGADYEANIEMFGKHINFTHHVGWSSWWMYRTTPIAKELIKAHFAQTESGFHTDIIVRSHVHYYVEVRFPHTIGFSTPAWKFPDGFLYRKGEPENPTIGMMEIIIEPNGEIIVESHIAELDIRKPMIHL